jgi:hypothetical protein
MFGLSKQFLDMKDHSSLETLDTKALATMCLSNGKMVQRPLALMVKFDPVTCAQYAKDNDLLDTDGWKSLKRIAKREKLFQCMIKQAKLKSLRQGIHYKYNVHVKHDFKEALRLDQKNGNTLWQDAIQTEGRQLLDYDTFISKGSTKKRTTASRVSAHLHSLGL